MADINPGKIAIFYVSFLLALCFHEFAHGFIAKKRGDNTAEIMGRLTMNPMAHLDWLGTVILPIVGFISALPVFGWAKPVPVNPRNLKDPKNDMFWVAIAGPASNFLLAIVGTIAWGVLARGDLGLAMTPFLREFLGIFILFNLFLAVFNLIPIHPLDGGKVMARFLPAEANRFLEDNQMILSVALLLIIVTGGIQFLVYPVYAIMGLLEYIFV